MTRTIAPAVLALAGTLPAYAQAQTDWESGFGHMMWGSGFGLLGGLMMLVFWGATIAALVLGLRWLMERDQKARRPDLDILKERLARGEIDPEEYKERRKVLES